MDEHEEVKTLYVGNLHPLVTDDVLRDLFGKEDVECLRIVRDKGQLYIYAFITFKSRAIAEQKLQQMNLLPYMGYRIKVNWAFQSSRKTFEHHLFVGDLGPEVTEEDLEEAFDKKGIVIRQAKIMLDPVTGRSKGYGFVAVQSREEAENAIQVMSGEQVLSKQIRCGHAQRKAAAENEELNNGNNSSNTVVYVGGLPPGITEDKVKDQFTEFGEVEQVKLQKKSKQQQDGKYAFVYFKTHEAAQQAITSTDGKSMDGFELRCSWGFKRTPAQPPSPGASQWPWHYPLPHHAHAYAYPPPTAAQSRGAYAQHPAAHVPHMYVTVPHVPGQPPAVFPGAPVQYYYPPPMVAQGGNGRQSRHQPTRSDAGAHWAGEAPYGYVQNGWEAHHYAPYPSQSFPPYGAGAHIMRDGQYVGGAHGVDRTRSLPDRARGDDLPHVGVPHGEQPRKGRRRGRRGGAPQVMHAEAQTAEAAT